MSMWEDLAPAGSGHEGLGPARATVERGGKRGMSRRDPMRIGYFPSDFVTWNPGYDLFVKSMDKTWGIAWAELSPLFDSLKEIAGQDIRCRNGVAWSDAPIPFRFHRCTPQTMGWTDYSTWTERCACGGIRGDRYPEWRERNQRRNSRRLSTDVR